jgi:hypothetical protein
VPEKRAAPPPAIARPIADVRAYSIRGIPVPQGAISQPPLPSTSSSNGHSLLWSKPRQKPCLARTAHLLRQEMTEKDPEFLLRRRCTRLAYPRKGVLRRIRRTSARGGFPDGSWDKTSPAELRRARKREVAQESGRVPGPLRVRAVSPLPPFDAVPEDRQNTPLSGCPNFVLVPDSQTSLSQSWGQG